MDDLLEINLVRNLKLNTEIMSLQETLYKALKLLYMLEDKHITTNACHAVWKELRAETKELWEDLKGRYGDL